MNNQDIARIAREAGAIDMTNNIAGGVTTWLGTGTPEFLERFAALVIANNPPQSFMSWQEGHAAGVAAERKAIYDCVLYETLKDPDLNMPETEVDDDAADDYFKSSEFRYAVNNVVKATIFTILSNIKAREKS